MQNQPRTTTPPPQQQEPPDYFTPLNEETTPFTPNTSINSRCYSLEQIYNDFFPQNSLSKAKEASKNERVKKQINDSSFIYGEIVINPYNHFSHSEV